VSDAVAFSRIDEIFAELHCQNPNDEFIQSYQNNITKSESMRNQYKEYDDCLQEMDNVSWNIIKGKAIEKYKSNKDGNLKEPFFNILNESKAYSFLIHNECNKVKMIKECIEHTTPDISAIINGKSLLCEVKTINISKKEINRRKDDGIIRGYFLEDGFFNKMHCDIQSSLIQMKKYSIVEINVIYFEINFDDFAGKHSSEYEKQIGENIINKFPEEYVFVHNWHFDTNILNKRLKA
jgi:hypothetical protein